MSHPKIGTYRIEPGQQGTYYRIFRKQELGLPLNRGRVTTNEWVESQYYPTTLERAIQRVHLMMLAEPTDDTEIDLELLNENVSKTIDAIDKWHQQIDIQVMKLEEIYEQDNT
jgi:hypothetical protein